MKFLELRIPPPIVALLIAAGMWWIAQVTPLIELPATSRIAVALILGVFGIGFTAAGVSAFRSAKTTVNPMKPETATTLMHTGVYGVSRNPMYLGLVVALTGWAIFLSAVLALVGPIAFVAFMNRFQIAPEEKALSQTFGAGYDVYRSKVRRWL